MMNTKDDEYSRFNAISALGYTGSRAAVPILLGLLRSPDPDLGGYAVSALRQLTHRSAVGELWSENSQSQYSKWVEWWNRDGISAPIYKATECGKLLP
jgi:HEAT repeat protein